MVASLDKLVLSFKKIILAGTQEKNANFFAQVLFYGKKLGINLTLTFPIHFSTLPDSPSTFFTFSFLVKSEMFEIYWNFVLFLKFAALKNFSWLLSKFTDFVQKNRILWLDRYHATLAHYWSCSALPIDYIKIIF